MYKECINPLRMYKGVLKHCKKCSLQKIYIFDNVLYLPIGVGHSLSIYTMG